MCIRDRYCMEDPGMLLPANSIIQKRQHSRIRACIKITFGTWNEGTACWKYARIFTASFTQSLKSCRNAKQSISVNKTAQLLLQPTMSLKFSRHWFHITGHAEYDTNINRKPTKQRTCSSSRTSNWGTACWIYVRIFTALFTQSLKSCRNA